MAISVVAVVAVLGTGFFGGRWIWDERDFRRLAAQGQAVLSEVVFVPSRGGGHPGVVPEYPELFPTSGPHSITWSGPGVYDEGLPRPQVVHALEHGHIVIYYDRPGDAGLKSLRGWAAHYDRNISGGVVVVSQPGLGAQVVLTAWTRLLYLDPFDAAAAAAFVDAFRGRGPEHATR